MQVISRTVVRTLGFALVLTALGGRAMAFGTPEIDPGSALSALTLLTGGVLMLTGRRPRK